MRAREDRLITMVTARLIVRELDARRIDTAPLLRAAGITREQLADAHLVMCWTRFVAIIESLQQLAPDEELPLAAGARIEISDLDLAGLYMRSAATGRDLALFHRRHQRLLEPSPMVSIYETEQGYVISYASLPMSPAGMAFAACSLAATVTLARALTGPIEPLEARLRRPRPSNVEPYVQVLGSRVRFGSATDEVLFPREFLSRALPHRDDAVRAVLEPHLARQLELAQAADADLPTRASLAIRDSLEQGAPSAEALAKQLHLSVRTLRRSLHACSTSYSALLEQARCELALRYAVEAPRRSGPEIARLLGYAEAHTFYRAFKRWTGSSLSEHRQRDASSRSAEPRSAERG